MKLVKYQADGGTPCVGLLAYNEITPLDLSGAQYQSIFDILESGDIENTIDFLVDTDATKVPVSKALLLPPIDNQEVWAAGVTYKRSKSARMEESESSASCYDKVFAADRPELFFKATAHRCVGQNQKVRIRSDATWNVPEPELTLVCNSRLEIVGFTIGNDMSSRDIEGENPLYLPQAKVYDQCAAIGPCIVIASAIPEIGTAKISLNIERFGAVVFKGETNVDQLNRTFESLVGYLGKECSFPQGVFLMTGTGIIPDNDFTLGPDDVINITIEGIGTLSNVVIQEKR